MPNSTVWSPRHSALQSLLNALSAATAPVYVVGGVVRDHLLGIRKSTNDMDVVVEHSALLVARQVADRLGTEHLGFIEALKVLTLGRVASSACAVGVARAALDESLRYASQRMQGDTPITRHQFVRFTLADMATRIEAAWRLTLHAARLVESAGDYDCAASMAKLFASETCTHVCERALHLCGAQGYMRESAAQRYYRDCKVFEIGEGTSEIQRETIFRHLAR